MEMFKMYFFAFCFVTTIIMVNIKKLDKVNREFSAFIISCLFLLIGSITMEIWMGITLIFLGVRTYQKQVIENGKVTNAQ